MDLTTLVVTLVYLSLVTIVGLLAYYTAPDRVEDPDLVKIRKKKEAKRERRNSTQVINMLEKEIERLTKTVEKHKSKLVSLSTGRTYQTPKKKVVKKKRRCD